MGTVLREGAGQGADIVELVLWDQTPIACLIRWGRCRDAEASKIVDEPVLAHMGDLARRCVVLAVNLGSVERCLLAGFVYVLSLQSIDDFGLVLCQRRCPQLSALCARISALWIDPVVAFCDSLSLLVFVALRVPVWCFVHSSSSRRPLHDGKKGEEGR